MAMNKKIIVKIVGLITVLVFIIVSLSFTSMERKHVVFSELQIEFKEPYQFITNKEIEKIIHKNFKGLEGTLLDTINTEIIEDKIEKLAWVKNAEVVKGYAAPGQIKLKGGLKIYIEQEVPVLRVVKGSDGYYVNANGKHMPYSSSYTTNVTVYTGSINDDDILNRLLNFEQFISSDPFLNALIQQIDVKSNNEMVLVPRVGDHLIEFGKPEDIELKFRNLKAVYKNGFDAEAWNKYKSVKLKYKNQVVCTLK